MITIQEIEIGQNVTLDIMRSTYDRFTHEKPFGAKYVKKPLTETPLFFMEIGYAGFTIQFCLSQKDFRRKWDPDKSYDKNYFATFFYHGRSDEYYDDGTWIRSFNEEGKDGFLNYSLFIEKPTYEIYDEMCWLCFSSWKPYTAKMIEVDGFYTIPSGCQAVVAIGSVTYGDLEIKTLDCISEGIVRGKAKIVLVEHGNFVNQPL